MTVYIKNPIVSIKKQLHLIRKYGKIEGYIVNIQISMAFLSERETRGKNPIYESNKKIK